MPHTPTSPPPPISNAQLLANEIVFLCQSYQAESEEDINKGKLNSHQIINVLISVLTSGIIFYQTSPESGLQAVMIVCEKLITSVEENNKT